MKETMAKAKKTGTVKAKAKRKAAAGRAGSSRVIRKVAARRAAAFVQNWRRLDVRPYDLADALVTLRDAEGLSQRELARKIGKAEGEVSKILTLLELDPAVQRMARQDRTGRIGRRHLYAVRLLPPRQQLSLIRKVQREAITADESERLAASRTKGRTTRRAHSATKRFKTSQATVTIVFQKENVTRREILDAIREVRARIAPAIAAS